MKHGAAWKGGRTMEQGYVYIYVPDHPLATQTGYVLEHRLVMENHLCQYLSKYEKSFIAMINFYSLIDKSLLLYFKCSQGHYTACKTGMQVFYCPKCDKMFDKKDCERYSDRPSTKVYKNGIRVRLSPTKTLYKFTDSVRRNYRKKISSWLPQK